MDIESKYKNEYPLKLPSKFKSLDTGEKNHAENLPGSYRKPPILLFVAFFHYRISYDVFSEGNISTLDKVPQGCGYKCS